MVFKFVAAIFPIAILIASVCQGYGKILPSRGRILDPGDNSTIVNPPHSQPWAVAVFAFDGKDTIMCSGTLISKRHVITSAHCKTVTQVAVGEHNLDINDGEETIKPINQIPYPGYENGAEADDLMIVVLEKEVNNKFAKPALLPKENEKFGEYIVSGFGAKTKSKARSAYLRTEELSDIGSDESCYKISPFYNPDKHICGENLDDIFLGPCNGDSGGPWVVKNEHGEAILAGVHKDGTCNNDYIPHMAVRVSHPKFLKWIKKVTGL